MEVPPLGEGMWGGRVGGGGERNNLDTVHGHAIYCDAADSGAVLGSRLASGSWGTKALVGEGGDKPVWYMSGGGDSSGDKGGG